MKEVLLDSYRELLKDFSEICGYTIDCYPAKILLKNFEINLEKFEEECKFAQKTN
jgi:hypothetical protein